MTERASQTHLNAISDIIAERKRQVDVEGFAPERDDQYVQGELASVAGCYRQSAARPRLFMRSPGKAFTVPAGWPLTWNLRDWWKPESPRRDLVKAAALIVAEIERLDRQAARDAEAGEPQ